MLAAHPRSRGRKAHVAIALATALLVLGGGILARRHEATVAHVVDLRTGLVTHALATQCHDRAPAAHLHALPGHQHRDGATCTITATAHQPAQAAAPLTIALAPPHLVCAELRRPIVDRQTSVLHAAPKTSPPAIG